MNCEEGEKQRQERAQQTNVPRAARRIRSLT